jgi:hypothetical protein
MTGQTRIFALALFSFMPMVLLVTPMPAYAQVTIIQAPSGGDLQAAIDQAAGIVNGPTPTDVVIEVAPGTYLAPSASDGLVVAAINSPTFTVTMRATQGPAVTTIDASNAADFAIRGRGTRNLTIDGFTIRNRIPDQTTFLGRGINLPNSSDITVENCHFDTTEQGVTFRIFDPSLSSNVQVVNNTGVVGQGTDLNAPNFVTGQLASMVRFFPVGTVEIGESRLIAANNVARCTASCVRFINEALDPNGNTVGAFSNGSLVMTGNDFSGGFGVGANFNILGGHGHIVAGNRLHDGGVGGFFQSASSGVIENNLIFNNALDGLQVLDLGPTSQDFSAEGRLIRHNTIVNNAGVGILYDDFDGGVHNFLPSVYNNVIAFNDAGGVAAIEQSPFAFAFISVSFSLAANDNYGNTLRNSQLDFAGISNPGAAAPDYSGVINTGLDLSVVPGFNAPQFQDFSLMPHSMLVNAGTTSRPTPFQDLAGHLRDAQPDIGAFEVVPTPVINVRSNPLRKGPKDQ